MTTIKQLVDKVRETLIDKNVPYRWETYFIVRSLFEAIMTIHKENPASRYAGLSLVHFDEESVSISGDEDVTDEILSTVPFLDPRFLDAMYYYALAKCFEIDSQDQENQQRSADAFAKFDNLAKS